MNEPHDLDVNKWSVQLSLSGLRSQLTIRASTIQAAVNAIRAAGAKTQMIAIPGTVWQHPEAYTDGTNAPILVSTKFSFSTRSIRTGLKLIRW